MAEMATYVHLLGHTCPELCYYGQRLVNRSKKQKPPTGEDTLNFASVQVKRILRYN